LGFNSSNFFGGKGIENDESLNSFSAGINYDFKIRNNILLGLDCYGSAGCKVSAILSLE